MRFGWLTLAMSPAPEQDHARIHAIIAQVEEAERLGFSDVWLTEHYFTGESVYNDAILFAGALAMRTSTIRLGFAVVQMPFHHPVRLATQLALLDNLSGGRIDVGIGKGTIYNEYEFIGHGLRSDDSRERMEEAADILVKAWSEAPLSYHGRFHRLEIPAIRPQPVQVPGPPLWRSAISPASFRNCGRLGIPVLAARLPVPLIRERWALYREGLGEGGHDAATRADLMAKTALWRFVYIAESDEQAHKELTGHLTRTREHMMHVRGSLNPPDFAPDPATLNAWSDPTVGHAEGVALALETGSLFGSPATVRRGVAELRDAGVEHLLCQTGFGDMSHAATLASMRRFAAEVMPEFA